MQLAYIFWPLLPVKKRKLSLEFSALKKDEVDETSMKKNLRKCKQETHNLRRLFLQTNKKEVQKKNPQEQRALNSKVGGTLEKCKSPLAHDVTWRSHH